MKQQLNNGDHQLLWNEQRNQRSCEAKAEALALRLKDRGWSCQTAGLEQLIDFKTY